LHPFFWLHLNKLGEIIHVRPGSFVDELH
jgi:hypothetical protein